ncbi:MAG: hypothetical protein M3081_18230 [Gemmatimonadota bacterium]|nr:hypothetical protein [Gemmatimonadota bacterium]
MSSPRGVRKPAAKLGRSVRGGKDAALPLQLWLTAGAPAAALRRLEQLRAALGDAKRCSLLVQHDPDPDAIASSLAIRAVLGLERADAPIVTNGMVTRPENKRLLATLGIRVRRVTPGQLRRIGPLVLIDVQPPYFGDELDQVAAVIDHHPVAGQYGARYIDVRTSYGASATMATEYLLATGNPALLTTRLATALLYGIITDTRSLSRSASERDLEAFAFLFPRADHEALDRIQHPSYSPASLRSFGDALRRARVRNGLAYLHLGKLPAAEEHVVAQFADFALGMRDAEIAVVSGVFGRRLVMSARALRPSAQLGDRLRALFGEFGSAGGHPVMAKAVIRPSLLRRRLGVRDDKALEREVERMLQTALADGRNRVGGKAGGGGPPPRSKIR